MQVFILPSVVVLGGFFLQLQNEINENNMIIESNNYSLIIEDAINEGIVEIGIVHNTFLNGETYYLDEDELIKLRDHLNKLIEQIK
jgi:hypothetical protein